MDDEWFSEIKEKGEKVCDEKKDDKIEKVIVRIDKAISLECNVYPTLGYEIYNPHHSVLLLSGAITMAYAEDTIDPKRRKMKKPDMMDVNEALFKHEVVIFQINDNMTFSHIGNFKMGLCNIYRKRDANRSPPKRASLSAVSITEMLILHGEVKKDNNLVIQIQVLKEGAKSTNKRFEMGTDIYTSPEWNDDRIDSAAFKTDKKYAYFSFRKPSDKAGILVFKLEYDNNIYDGEKEIEKISNLYLIDLAELELTHPTAIFSYSKPNTIILGGLKQSDKSMIDLKGQVVIHELDFNEPGKCNIMTNKNVDLKRRKSDECSYYYETCQITCDNNNNIWYWSSTKGQVWLMDQQNGTMTSKINFNYGKTYLSDTLNVISFGIINSANEATSDIFGAIIRGSDANEEELVPIMIIGTINYVGRTKTNLVKKWFDKEGFSEYFNDKELLKAVREWANIDDLVLLLYKFCPIPEI